MNRSTKQVTIILISGNHHNHYNRMHHLKKKNLKFSCSVIGFKKMVLLISSLNEFSDLKKGLANQGLHTKSGLLPVFEN